MTKKKLLMFDFWGTLIENGVKPSPSKQVRYFLRVRIPFPEFIHTFEEAFMTKEYDTLKDGFVAVTKAFDKPVPDFVYDKMVGMWNKFSILSKPFEETVEALEKLSEKYDLVILSNTDSFSLRQVVDKFDLEKYFKKIYMSCEMGMLKANPNSYKKVLEEMGVSAEEALMIGDSPQSDVISAEAAGVDAVLIDRRGWYEDGPKISSLLELDDYVQKLEKGEIEQESSSETKKDADEKQAE